jgi:hypothetical protein
MQNFPNGARGLFLLKNILSMPKEKSLTDMTQSLLAKLFILFFFYLPNYLFTAHYLYTLWNNVAFYEIFLFHAIKNERIVFIVPALSKIEEIKFLSAIHKPLLSFSYI